MLNVGYWNKIPFSPQKETHCFFSDGFFIYQNGSSTLLECHENKYKIRLVFFSKTMVSFLAKDSPIVDLKSSFSAIKHKA